MKYRKKPVVIEAMQLPTEPDTSAVEAIVEWMAPGLVARWEESDDEDPDDPIEDYGSNYVYIKTLEGTMIGRLGDYIICGVQGEFYPCKPDIFEATYEAVSDD